MFDAFCLGVALTVGQGSPPVAEQLPPPPAARTTTDDGQPRRIPAALPAAFPGRPVPVTVYVAGEDPPPPKKGDPKADPKKDAPEAKKDEEKKEEEDKRGWFMKSLDGTEFGAMLKAKNISVSGWIEASYTHSKANGPSNLPVTWNDRANRFLLNQAWLRIEEPLDTEAKTPTFGWHVDFLYGSDYRYTLQRGFLNEQLLNARGNQNIYGFDMPQAYVNGYFPDIFEGTEVRAGRFFTPFGYESVEGPTTPLLSRSYAFTWCPPFTHWGVAAIANLDKEFQVFVAAVNGNDVMLCDPAEEWRGLFKLQYTSEDKKTTWAFGTSIGRGRFDTSEPFAPSTFGTANEPAGRNNINVFDFTISEQVSDEETLAFEAIYGYQTNVPANVPGGLIDTTKFPGQSGTAHWGSLVGYSLYKFSDEVTGVARGEVFWDCEGQRTGFIGPYYAGTIGLQIKPKDCLLIRPELRYDYNGTSTPFDGGTKHGLGTAAIDVILLY